MSNYVPYVYKVYFPTLYVSNFLLIMEGGREAQEGRDLGIYVYIQLKLYYT